MKWMVIDQISAQDLDIEGQDANVLVATGNLGSRGDNMWLLDFFTLLLVLAAGLYVGYLGVSGDAIAVADNHVMRWFFCSVGVSAIWQLMRQRFF